MTKNILLAYILFCSCSTKFKKTEQDSWDKQNLRDISVDDSAYLSAIKAAQNGLPLFIKLLNDRQNNHLTFYIKSKFNEGTYYEHMWSIPDSFANNSFFATIDNVPNKLTKVNYKDKVKIQADKVEDWIISEGDSTILGNFISHALKK